MAIAHFPSLDDAEAIEVSFLKPQGGEVTLRLLVDSGFTGESSFVLPSGSTGLAHALAAPRQTAGALQGTQKRVLVTARIPALSFQTPGIAILADTAALGLPPGVHGMAGLQFLRNFHRWGSERTEAGGWQFFLETQTT